MVDDAKALICVAVHPDIMVITAKWVTVTELYHKDTRALYHVVTENAWLLTNASVMKDGMEGGVKEVTKLAIKLKQLMHGVHYTKYFSFDSSQQPYLSAKPPCESVPSIELFQTKDYLNYNLVDS